MIYTLQFGILNLNILLDYLMDLIHGNGRIVVDNLRNQAMNRFIKILFQSTSLIFATQTRLSKLKFIFQDVKEDEIEDEKPTEIEVINPDLVISTVIPETEHKKIFNDRRNSILSGLCS